VVCIKLFMDKFIVITTFFVRVVQPNCFIRWLIFCCDFSRSDELNIFVIHNSFGHIVEGFAKFPISLLSHDLIKLVKLKQIPQIVPQLAIWKMTWFFENKLSSYWWQLSHVSNNNNRASTERLCIAIQLLEPRVDLIKLFDTNH